MNLGGIIFLLVAWGIVGGVTFWCFARMLFPRKDR
jgi:hypothetical protein